MKKIPISYITFVFFLLFHSTMAQSNFNKSTISIGIIVEDLNKSINFYTNVLGMSKVREFIVDVDKASKMGLSKNKQFDIKVLKIENTENATELKLMSFKRKKNYSKQKYLSDSNGIRYLTFYVKSMKLLIENIKKYNVKLLGESPVMLDLERQFILIQDPDGNFIEFIGPQ